MEKNKKLRNRKIKLSKLDQIDKLEEEIDKIICRTKKFIQVNNKKIDVNCKITNSQSEKLSIKIGTIDLTEIDLIKECNKLVKECLICFETCNTLDIICEHYICENCAEKWISQHGSKICPFCKREFKELIK